MVVVREVNCFSGTLSSLLGWMRTAMAFCQSVCVCVCVCMCVHACVRACVRVVCVHAWT